jgi:hypothetical protein
MTDILASLMHKGVLSLDLVAQDGIRIRAAATAPSFRRYESLLECREQAALHLKAILGQADGPEITRAQQAAREAGARDFACRVEEAIMCSSAGWRRSPASRSWRRSRRTCCSTPRRCWGRQVDLVLDDDLDQHLDGDGDVDVDPIVDLAP